MAANHMMDMYITASSAIDIYYLVRKYLHSVDQAKQGMVKAISPDAFIVLMKDK